MNTPTINLTLVTPTSPVNVAVGQPTVAPTVNMQVTPLNVSVTGPLPADFYATPIGTKGDKGDAFTYEDFTPEQLAALKGDKGDPAAGYVHDQIASSRIWTINHNLGYFPSVTVVDTGANVIVGDISYTSLNQVIIEFAVEFSGKAFLN